MLARLLQIGAVARAIERHFPLFAAALRADAPMNCGAKAFLFPDFTDNTAQSGLLKPLLHPKPTQLTGTETQRKPFLLLFSFFVPLCLCGDKGSSLLR